MRSPFKLLDAYSAADKHVFFGRTTEVEELYTLVFKTNLLVVYGLSGTGKTSVIQCGLASKFDGPDWYPMFIRRNDDLNVSLRLALQTALRDEVKDDLVENVTHLIRRTLRPVYLIFDQFEELFILGSQSEQEAFMADLKNLLDSGLNAKVLLVMREEYIGQLYPYEQIIPQLFDFRFRVEPMGIAKVKSVIRDSFGAFNIHLEEPQEETLQIMVEQISDPKSGIALPYLQVYLDMLYRETYRKKYGKEVTDEQLPRIDITKTDIESLGRIGNVLEKFLAQQTAELNEVLRSEFPAFPANGLQLILDPFATDEGTKRPVHYARAGDDIELDRVIQKMLPELPSGSLNRAIGLLDHARILRIREDTIELAHDSLAAIVDQKRTGEQRQLQELRRRLTNAYEEFQKTGLHLNEKQLVSFEEYLPKLQLNDDLKGFIRDSEADVVRQKSVERSRLQQEREAKQQKKLARTRGVLLTVALAFATVAVILGFRAHNNYKKADYAAKEIKQKRDSLQVQFNITGKQQDSIENILIQVDQQLSRMDSVIKGRFRNPDIEIRKSYVTLKSLVSDDTLTDAQAKALYASAEIAEIVAEVYGEEVPGPPEREFALGQEVIFWAKILAKSEKELLHVKWFGPDGKIVGNLAYLMVERTRSGQTYVSTSAEFDESGVHEVKLFNEAGREIASEKFTVTKTKVLEVAIRPGNFKIVSSVVGGNPGRETSKFRRGSTVYWWMRIHNPLDADEVTVQVMQPNGEIWPEDYKIGRNMTTQGYLVWDAKGFSLAGNYTIRVLNSKGGELASKQFVME